MSKSNSKLTSAIIEVMESRRLLTSTLSSGILTITGTAGNDVTTLSVSGTNIMVLEGATSHLFPTVSVTKIVADMQGGNDKLSLTITVNVPASLLGGGGNDTIVGGARNDTIRGGDGNDNLSGNPGNDILDGNSGTDSLYGNAGNDTFTGGIGNDTLDGGVDADTVDYSARTTSVTANLYQDDTRPGVIYGFGGEAGENDTYGAVENIIGGSSNDTLSFTIQNFSHGPDSVSHNIQLTGGPGKDKLRDYCQRPYMQYALHGAMNNVTLSGGDGIDAIYAGSFDFVTVNGQGGNDTLTTDTGISLSSMGPAGRRPTIDLGSGNDTWIDSQWNTGGTTLYDLNAISTVENLTLTESASVGPFPLKIIGNAAGNVIQVIDENLASSTTIIGNGGDDTISATVGSIYNISGNDGNDKITIAGKGTVSGGAGNDSIVGSSAADSLDGNDGNDTIRGGDGEDYIQGGLGNDSLLGMAGNDTLDGDVGGFLQTNDFDTMDAGAGNDFIWATDTGHSTIFGGIGNDTISGSGVSNVTDGGAGNDSISGTDGNDSLTGGDGNDTITASKGNDTVNGGLGDDSLVGADGNDLIHGNAGNDTITGGAGTDSVFGDDGNDWIYSKDTISEVVDGGNGTDKAHPDVIDGLISIEGFF